MDVRRPEEGPKLPSPLQRDPGTVCPFLVSGIVHPNPGRGAKGVADPARQISDPYQPLLTLFDFTNESVALFVEPSFFSPPEPKARPSGMPPETLPGSVSRTAREIEC